jgi:hypothetical protein
MMDRRNVLKMAGGFVIGLHASDPLAPVLSWDFEAGSLVKVETIGTDRFRCHVKGQTDQDGRNRQASWYYFRVDGAKGRTLTFEMVDLAGEYNYRPNSGSITRGTLPFFSIDRRTWIPIDKGEYDERGPSLRYQVRVPSSRIWIAHVPPYTTADFRKFSGELARSRSAGIETIGRSVEGRTIPLITITDQSAPSQNKKVIWLMFRQHAWEAGSSWTGEGLMRFAVSDDPRAQEIRRAAVLKILPLNDPDGVANGTVRFNRYGYDLNRNWDVVEPEKMPEITAERQAIVSWVNAGHPVDFFLTLHNDEDNEYLAGPPDSQWLPLLHRVWNAWAAGTTVAPTEDARLTEATTTEGKPGRMNVVQGLSRDLRLPAFEIEMRITKHPKLGHRPNVEDRLLAGKELLLAIWKGL